MEKARWYIDLVERLLEGAGSGSRAQA